MKTKLTTLIATLVATVVGIGTAFGQPPTGGSTSTAIPSVGSPAAGASTSATRHGLQLMSDPYVGVNIELVMVLLPPQNMASSWDARKRFQEDYLNGTLKPDAGYTVITNGVIGWKDIVYAEGGEISWRVLQQFIIVRSKDGSNSISLSMLRVSATSTGDALNSTYQAGNFGYSDIVVGYPNSGLPVTSGSPDQLVSVIAITTQMSLFNGGGTQAGLDQVMAYVMGHENFTIDYRVTMTGDSDSEGTTRVSIRVPTLEWTTAGVMLVGDTTDHLYDLFASDVVAGGGTNSWTKVGTLRSGQVWQVNRRAKSAQFFRAVLSP